MILKRKCVVEEFDCNVYVIMVKWVDFLVILVEYGKLLKFLEILDFLICEKENIFCLVINMFFFSIDDMIKDFEFVLGIVVFWIKKVKL